MKKLLATLAACVGLAAPFAASAADNVVLVELFTSQGCSSCPPADANLAELADRDDVLALSMHVDYWDYLGWKDTFGSPANTKRQYAYRDHMGARVVYTPQMIIQGRHDVPGYRPDLIEGAIQSVAAASKPAGLAIEEADGRLTARLSMTNVRGTCTVWIASYRQKAEVDIANGENRGRKITYHNIVEKLMRAGTWTSSGPEVIDLPLPGAGEGIAVWIQNDKTGEILAVSFVEN
ncbi:MAG: DUF1223 domain-containing protein [Pseudomonadota bacterium]